MVNSQKENYKSDFRYPETLDSVSFLIWLDSATIEQLERFGKYRELDFYDYG